ncbi:MAG: tetratricopeptide repeat protein [Planctomycetota bacterium]|nr:tetratricopeptide repeat protein [Planctomycetota bacterium]
MPSAAGAFASAGSSADAGARASIVWWCVLVAIGGLVPFLPAISGGFSDFDDVGFLLEVDAWRGLGADNLAWMFGTAHLGHYQPLTYLSYAIEHSLFGLDARVFHATNIALHALNAVLVFLLARRLLVLARVTPHDGAYAEAPSTSKGADQHNPAMLIGAAAGALLWAVHPLRVESVAWITERRDVLSAALLFAGTLAYLRSAEHPEPAPASARWYWLSVALVALSLLAKAWGITFVAVAILLDIYPLRRLSWRAAVTSRRAAAARVLAQKIPFAVLALVFAGIASWAQRTAGPGTVKSLGEWGVAERAAQSAYGLVFYLWKTLWPADLSALYELPIRIVWTDARWASAAVIVTLLGAGAIALRRRVPGVACALAAYAIVVSPVLGVMQSGIQLVADRYSYLAIVPVMILLGAGVAWVWREGPARWPHARRAATAFGGVVLLVLGALSWQRSGLWGSTLALWEDAVANGHDGFVTRNFLGTQLEKAKRPREAIEQYRRSLAFNDRYADSWLGLGTSHRALGEFAEAEAAFRRAADFAPDPTRAHLALGTLYMTDLGRPADAIAALRAGAEWARAHGNPSASGAIFITLAAAYGMTGDEAAAVPWLREAARWPDTRAAANELLRDLGQPL